MALCTRWACSRSFGPLLILLLSWGEGEPSRGQSVGSWAHGVFPIDQFLGYTSHYGQRVGPDGQPQPHHGLDIAAPLHSPVRSWWSGQVIETIQDASCGVGVQIRSGPYDHIYCHLDAQRMRRGEHVQTGQVIGRIGLTGRTTGPHLHWGIRYRGQWIDPTRVLRAMIRQRRADGASGD